MASLAGVSIAGRLTRIAWAVALLLLVAAVLPACSARLGSIDDVAPIAVSPREQALAHRAEALVAAGVPGVLVRVVGPNEDIAVSAGVADRSTSLPIETDTLFQLGAVSNTYLATSMLRQSDDGLLDLGNNVEHYLPGVYDYGWDIAVYDVLQHASGIPNYSEPVVDACVQSGACIADPDAPVEATRDLAREFQPGEGWSFSNTNYVIAGHIAERVSGQTWQRVVEEQITEPLGLSRTRLPIATSEWAAIRSSADVARAYADLDGDGDLEDASQLMPGGFGADGGMLASADDLLGFFRPLLRGDFLSAPLQTALFATAPTSYGREDFGLGLSFIHGFAEGQVGHTGQAIGHSVFVEHDLTTDVTTVVVANQSGDLPAAQWSALIGTATGLPNREVRERSADGPGQLRLYCELY